MFALFRIGRGITRAAGNRPSKPRQSIGVPWPWWVLGGLVIAWPMELLEHHGMQKGIAFLIMFPVFAVILGIGALVSGAGKGGKQSRAGTARQVRQMHEAMEQDENSDKRTGR